MPPIPLPSPSSSLRGLLSHVFISISPLRKRLLVDGPSPGAVVGIVLGSVAGFILLIILFWLLSGGVISVTDTSVSGEEEVVVRRRSRSPRRSHRSRRSASIREVREVTRSPRPGRVIVEPRTERIRDPRPRSSEVVIEERTEILRSPERRVPGDDIVEVTEEHSDLQSPPRRRDSDRRRSRRSSGYRSVDPNLYAGGNYPQHPIPRRRDSFSDLS